MAKPEGEEKAALVGTPSAQADVPFPASTLVAPVAATTALILLFELSATYTNPLALQAKPAGYAKAAAAPTPSAKEKEPLPARVLTTPAGVILRTLLLPRSPTKTTPPRPHTTQLLH